MMVEDGVENLLFRESEVIVARRLSGVRHVADILDSSGEVLAEIRSRPRVILGCLTIFVAVAAFFGIPVLIAWLTNGLLRLLGSDLESLMDRHIAVAVIVVILIIASGIVAAMSAAWSLYRRRLRAVMDSRQTLFEVAETRKFGAASVTAAVRDPQGRLIGRVHRDYLGRFTLRDGEGNRLFSIASDRSGTRSATEAGMMAAAMTAIAIVSAALLGAALLMLMKPGRGTFYIQRFDDTAPSEPLSFGRIVPDESSGCRIRLTRPTTPPERCLLLATVILLVIYDF